MYTAVLSNGVKEGREVMLGLCTRNEVFVYVDAHVHSKAHTDIHWYERMYAHTHTQAIHTHTHLHMNTRTHMHTNAYTHYLCFILLCHDSTLPVTCQLLLVVTPLIVTTSRRCHMTAPCSANGLSQRQHHQMGH